MEKDNKLINRHVICESISAVEEQKVGARGAARSGGGACRCTRHVRKNLPGEAIAEQTERKRVGQASWEAPSCEKERGRRPRCRPELEKLDEQGGGQSPGRSGVRRRERERQGREQVEQPLAGSSGALSLAVGKIAGCRRVVSSRET